MLRANTNWHYANGVGGWLARVGGTDVVLRRKTEVVLHELRAQIAEECHRRADERKRAERMMTDAEVRRQVERTDVFIAEFRDKGAATTGLFFSRSKRRKLGRCWDLQSAEARECGRDATFARYGSRKWLRPRVLGGKPLGHGTSRDFSDLEQRGLDRQKVYSGAACHLQHDGPPVALVPVARLWRCRTRNDLYVGGRRALANSSLH